MKFKNVFVLAGILTVVGTLGVGGTLASRQLASENQSQLEQDFNQDPKMALKKAQEDLEQALMVLETGQKEVKKDGIVYKLSSKSLMAITGLLASGNVARAVMTYSDTKNATETDMYKNRILSEDIEKYSSDIAKLDGKIRNLNLKEMYALERSKLLKERARALGPSPRGVGLPRREYFPPEAQEAYLRKKGLPPFEEFVEDKSLVEKVRKNGIKKLAKDLDSLQYQKSFSEQQLSELAKKPGFNTPSWKQSLTAARIQIAQTATLVGILGLQFYFNAHNSETVELTEEQMNQLVFEIIEKQKEIAALEVMLEQQES